MLLGWPSLRRSHLKSRFLIVIAEACRIDATLAVQSPSRQLSHLTDVTYRSSVACISRQRGCVRRLCTSIVLHLICRSVRTRNCAQTKPWWAHPPVQLSQLIDGRSRLDPATSALCCGTPSLIIIFWSRPFCRRQRCIIKRPVTAPASSFHASSRRNCR